MEARVRMLIAAPLGAVPQPVHVAVVDEAVPLAGVSRGERLARQHVSGISDDVGHGVIRRNGWLTIGPSTRRPGWSRLVATSSSVSSMAAQVQAMSSAVCA